MSQNEDLNPQPLLSVGEVEIENIINKLIVEGYLLAAPDVGILSLSSKLVRFYKEKMQNTQLPKQTSIIKKSDEDKKIGLREFKELAEVPFRIKTQNFNFTANAISQEAEKYFNKNVAGKVNMETLIQLTKAYYKDETQARPTLSNYFLQGIWEGVLKEYKPKNSIKVANEQFTGDRKL